MHKSDQRHLKTCASFGSDRDLITIRCCLRDLVVSSLRRSPNVKKFRAIGKRHCRVGQHTHMRKCMSVCGNYIYGAQRNRWLQLNAQSRTERAEKSTSVRQINI